MKKEVWLITGISSGLGREIAQAALEAGHFVVGSFRDPSQVEAYNNENETNSFAIHLDITDQAQIKSSVQNIEQKFGKIDVLVNNAGFGMAGAVEETSLSEVREVFEVNFFGALALTQAVLPIFRKNKKGHIIQMSSHGGFKAFAGFGIYNASKFALEGLSEALAQEVAPLGIKATIVEPGPFRTNFAGKGFRLAERSIDDYAQTAGVFRERIKSVDGKQEGDPQKAAKAIVKIVDLANPPLRLPLGKVAVASLTTKLAQVQGDLDAFKELAESVVF